MATITEDELLQKGRELGTVEAAIKWMKSQGLTLAANPIPAADKELPPVRQPQSGLEAAAAADEADAAAEDEAAAADNAEAGALDYGNLDFTKMRNDPSIFQQLLKANAEANQRAEQSAKQLYDEGRKRIAEKYAGPSQAERLFALSRAMLSPTKVPGFAGFLGNVTGALSENAKAAREAEQSREEKLFELQQQYQQGQAARQAAMPKTAADLALKYLTATKNNGQVRGIAVGNRLVDPYTNLDIEPPVGTIKMYKGRKYQYMGGGDQYDQSNWKEVR